MKCEDSEYLFEILCGTYEEYLLGYKFQLTDEKYNLVQTIANHTHRASLRCVDAYKNHLASGGADENIHLYDLKDRNQGGILMHHTGTITTLCFTPDGSHLVSGGEDGAIAIVRVGNWVLEKIWTKAHKGSAVHSISVHPSGKLALSIGADKTLRTWNLIKGRPAYTVNVANKCKRPEIIKWSVCGEYFGLVNDNVLEIYSVASGLVEKTIPLKHRITCVDFFEGNKVCFGDWAGNVTCYSFLTGEENWKLAPTEEIRIKTITHYNNWLVSANSQGKIFVYDMNTPKPTLVSQTDTKCRITCLTVSRVPDDQESVIKKKKRKKNKKKEDLESIQKEEECSPPKVLCYPPTQKWEITAQT